MKVVQINAVSGLGSTGRNCTEITEYLNAHGIEGYAACSVGEKGDNIFLFGSAAEKKIHAICSRLFGLQGYFSWLGTKKLIHYLRKIQPDVVNLNNLHSNYIHMPNLLNYLADSNIITVLTLHDCWFYTGKCCHYTVDQCNKWKTGCGGCVRKKKDNKSLFFDFSNKMWKDKKNAFEKIDNLYVIGVSNWITEEARKSFLNCAKEIKRIYNWIDLDVFTVMDTRQKRLDLRLENKKIILGVASVWCQEKGIQDFIDLSMALSDNYQIILVGKWSAAERGKIMNIGSTNDIAELAQYYAMADVFLTFSKEESFGKVSAEALACGTPVICFDSTANSELVGEGCGSVLRIGDTNGLMEAIATICANGKDTYQLICRKFALDNFNKNTNLEQYQKLYEQTVINREEL